MKAYIRISLLLRIEFILLYIYATFWLHINWLMNIGVISILTIVNLAEDIDLQISVRLLLFNHFGYISRNGIVRLYGTSMFMFLFLLSALIKEERKPNQ